MAEQAMTPYMVVLEMMLWLAAMVIMQYMVEMTMIP
jgi:hypothetical protein